MFLPFEMIWQGEYENVQFALCNDIWIASFMVKKPEKNIRKGLSVIFVEEKLGRVYI